LVSTVTLGVSIHYDNEPNGIGTDPWIDHAHYQTTYSDGAIAGLTLYGPSSAEYDEALPPMFMQDWIHVNSSDAFKQELAGGIPVAANLLFNGNGIDSTRMTLITR